MPLLTVPLEGLPSSGKLGFYVRLRGAARIVPGVVRGTATMTDKPIIFQDFEGAEPAFREVIVPPDMIAWATADQAPASIFLAAAPGPTATEPGLTYVQIDCILPIVTR
jgi:hypothetical protein